MVQAVPISQCLRLSYCLQENEQPNKDPSGLYVEVHFLEGYSILSSALRS